MEFPLYCILDVLCNYYVEHGTIDAMGRIMLLNKSTYASISGMSYIWVFVVTKCMGYKRIPVSYSTPYSFAVSKLGIYRCRACGTKHRCTRIFTLSKTGLDFDEKKKGWTICKECCTTNHFFMIITRKDFEHLRHHLLLSNSGGILYHLQSETTKHWPRTIQWYEKEGLKRLSKKTSNGAIQYYFGEVLNMIYS